MIARAAIRLLIVEDGADDRMVYRLILKQRPAGEFTVTLAVSGEDGLAALRSDTFDCMLLDYDMPDMTGLELLDQVAQDGGALPCPTIIVTGGGNDRLAEEAARRGVARVLLKEEIDDDRLLHAIETAIGTSLAPRDPAAVSGARAATAVASPVAPLSIAEAKLGLAATFGVRPANVEIIIRG